MFRFAPLGAPCFDRAEQGLWRGYNEIYSGGQVLVVDGGMIMLG